MSKRIVLCADGTWNTPHGPAEMPNDTNVRKLFLLLNGGPPQRAQRPQRGWGVPPSPLVCGMYFILQGRFSTVSQVLPQRQRSAYSVQRSEQRSGRGLELGAGTAFRAWRSKVQTQQNLPLGQAF